MKYMVCNCNSYGNIDYGIPTVFAKDDFRTSNDVGLRYIPLPQPRFYREKDPGAKGGEPLLDIKFESNKTQYTKDYGQKYRKWESKPSQPLPMPKTHYMRTIKEQMFKNPPAPRKFPICEYKEEYSLKQPEPIADKVKPVDELAFCKVSSIGRGEQPRIKIEDKGVMKRLDAYVSTNTMSYIPFTKDQLFAAKKQPLTIYNSKNAPELQRIKIRKPIIDETKFKKVIKDRIVPNLIYRVPFSGKCTEYKSNYMKPTKGCLYVASLDLGVVFEDSLSKASKWQTLAAPNMYCTEYCHIGTGRNVKTAVHTKEEKMLMKHDYCK